MLNTDVDTLGDDTVSDELVNLDTDGALGDVPNDTGLSVVELVGHTLLDGTITDNIDNLTELEDLEVTSGGNGSTSSELLREQVSGAGSVTE